MSVYPFAVDTPVHVAKVGLRARDADGLSDYYRTLLGLSELRRSADAITLGVGEDGLELLEIERAPSAKPDDPRSAGLFHTAFLLPSRVELARWIRHAGENRFRVEGASDHLVSEALYLTDPEGNGIEIYADRSPEAWPRDDGVLRMATERLDIDGLMATLPADAAPWGAAPLGTVIGHVHLRVGDPVEAEKWWNGEMGLETMVRYGDAAVFLATGGYHHHVGANVWHSLGASARDQTRSGLSYVEMRAKGGAARAATDPWGTEIRVATAA